MDHYIQIDGEWYGYGISSLVEKSTEEFPCNPQLDEFDPSIPTDVIYSEKTPEGRLQAQYRKEHAGQEEEPHEIPRRMIP